MDLIIENVVIRFGCLLRAHYSFTEQNGVYNSNCDICSTVNVILRESLDDCF